MKIQRISEVKKVFGYRSNTTIYSLINEGLFSRPVPIHRRSVGWPESEVQTICAARISGKHDDEIRGLVDQLHAKRLAALEKLVGSEE